MPLELDEPDHTDRNGKNGDFDKDADALDRDPTREEVGALRDTGVEVWNRWMTSENDKEERGQRPAADEAAQDITRQDVSSYWRQAGDQRQPAALGGGDAEDIENVGKIGILHHVR